MIRRVAAALALAILVAGASPLAATVFLPPMSASIADFRGHARVLIVVAPSEPDSRLGAQRALLEAGSEVPTGLRERDVVTVFVGGQQVRGANDAARAIRARYRIPPDAFRVLLIGKDGHVVYRQSGPIRPAALFATIDAMPMRRDEMRARNR